MSGYVQTGRDPKEPVKAGCAECSARGRRGMVAVFGGSGKNDRAAEFLRRHSKHGG